MVVSLPLLDLGASPASSPQGASRAGPAGASRVEAFTRAMDRAAPGPEGLAGATDVGPSGRVDDQARARQVLELGVPPAADSAGDAILGGLQKIRGVLDVRYDRISRVTGANLTSVEAMFEMQREIVHYSMLLDITSKLTGKATQVVDQLMKGQ